MKFKKEFMEDLRLLFMRALVTSMKLRFLWHKIAVFMTHDPWIVPGDVWIH